MPGDGGLTVGQRIGQLETAVVGLSARVDGIESWRDELRGAMALVKFTLGSSIIAAVISVLTILALIAQNGGHP